MHVILLLKLRVTTVFGGYEFIAYLDDDDEWLPEKLEKQIARFRECGGKTALIYCDSYLMNDTLNTERLVRYTDRALNEGNIYTELLRENFIAMVVLVRARCLYEIGGFDERLPALEDYEAWLRLAKLYEFGCVAEPLVRVYVQGNREHLNSNSALAGVGSRQIIIGNWDYFKYKYSCFKKYKCILLNLIWRYIPGVYYWLMRIKRSLKGEKT